LDGALSKTLLLLHIYKNVKCTGDIVNDRPRR